MDDFVSKYPDNYYVNNAMLRRDDLLFLPVKAIDRVSRYRWFISIYPEDRNVAHARERINTVLAACERVRLETVAKYPHSHLWKKV
jgi:hypothetical protein